MQFQPLEPSELTPVRRALLPLRDPVARVLRWAWSHTGHSTSTWCDSRRWRAVWNVVRWFGAVPRQRPELVQCRFGPRIVMELDLSRLTDVLALCYGPGENEVGYACRRLCPPDGVVADIGGNIGTTALAFAAHVPAGRVHVFEPSPAMLTCLRRNIELSGATNVTVHAYGVGDVARSGRLQVAIAGNPGSAFIADGEAERGDGSVGDAIEVRRLDEALAGLGRLDFVKIDVEGLELRVLRGGEALLRRHRPSVLFEVNEGALRRGGTSGREVCEYLLSLGYRLHYLQAGKFRAYDVATMPARKLHNVIASSRDLTTLL